MADAVDMVNHPKHYESCNLECIDVMVLIFGVEKTAWYCLENAFKYLYRHESKNGKEDIDKAAWYISWVKQKKQSGYCFDQQLLEIADYLTKMMWVAQKKYKC